jgi:hypothetical protein
MDNNCIRFLHQFRNGSHVFDVGRNGRRIINLGELQFVDLKDSKPWRHKIKVELALCNDVLLICAVKGQGETIRELLAVSERDSLQVDDSLLPPGDLDRRPLRFAIRTQAGAFAFEAVNTAERQTWVQLLQDRSTMRKSSQLRGPRLVPLARLTREEVVRWMDIPDPFQTDGQTELEKEWRQIPKVCECVGACVCVHVCVCVCVL